MYFINITKKHKKRVSYLCYSSAFNQKQEAQTDADTFTEYKANYKKMTDCQTERRCLSLFCI